MDESRFPVRTFPTVDELAGAAFGIIRATLAMAREDHPVTIVLSGGSTPIPILERLSTADAIAWDQVHIFWGDERSVPPNDEQSNYRMARETLLKKIDIPDENIHRIQAELAPEEAAELYEAEIRQTMNLAEDEIPQFDLLLLGMGEDGHTASLFPATAALDERKRLVVANEVPQLETTRITMTYPVLNAARQIIFLVSGSNKADALRQILTGPSDALPPAGRIQQVNGSTIWLIDEDAMQAARAAPNEPES